MNAESVDGYGLDALDLSSDREEKFQNYLKGLCDKFPSMASLATDVYNQLLNISNNGGAITTEVYARVLVNHALINADFELSSDVAFDPLAHGTLYYRLKNLMTHTFRVDFQLDLYLDSGFINVLLTRAKDNFDNPNVLTVNADFVNAETPTLQPDIRMAEEFAISKKLILVIISFSRTWIRFRLPHTNKDVFTMVQGVPYLREK